MRLQRKLVSMYQKLNKLMFPTGSKFYHPYWLPNLAASILAGIPRLNRYALEKWHWKTDGVIILMYHDVSPEVFEKHTEFVTEHYKFVDMREISSILKNGKGCERGVAITFDDGYQGNYNLLSIIKKYQAPVTIYAVSKWVMNDNPRFLTCDQLKEMIDTGLVNLGSHTCEHLDLVKEHYRTAELEIAVSKFDLGDAIGQCVFDFSYPWGKYTNETIGLVKRAQFKTAVTTKAGVNNAATSPFELKRLTVDPSMNKYVLAMKINGFWYEKLGLPNT